MDPKQFLIFGSSLHPRAQLRRRAQWLMPGKDRASIAPLASIYSKAINIPGASFSKVTEGLYQLNRADDCPEVDVVFFHGLQRQSDYSDAWLTTWQGHPTSFWPAHAVAAKFPEARILFASYDSTEHGGQTDATVGKALFAALVMPPGNVGQKRTVIFVAHSMGGLAVKALCCAAREVASDTGDRHATAAQDFLRNVRLVAYIATPHTGARLADIRNLLPNRPTGMAALLETLNQDAGRLNLKFAKLERQYNFRQIAFFETKGLRVVPWLPWFTVMVVSEASATAYCNESVGCPETDHVSIARPTDMQHSTLTSKIKLAMQDACRPPGVICTRRLDTGSTCGNFLYSEEALVRDGGHSWQLDGSDTFEEAKLITAFKEGAVRVGDEVIHPYSARQGTLSYRDVFCSKCRKAVGWYVDDLECNVHNTWCRYQVGKYGVVDKHTRRLQ